MGDRFHCTRLGRESPGRCTVFSVLPKSRMTIISCFIVAPLALSVKWMAVGAPGAGAGGHLPTHAHLFSYFTLVPASFAKLSCRYLGFFFHKGRASPGTGAAQPLDAAEIHSVSGSGSWSTPMAC